jgi:predicted AlkP superfamily pyrophosphatase or phosphodiesterase
MKMPNYKHSIMNVSRSFLKHYGLYDQSDTILKLDEQLKKNYKHIIYMLLDGLGDNLLRLHLKEDDFFRKHQIDTITSVFPPTTVAATNAVLAAKPPISTGYLGWVQYFKDMDMQGVVFMDVDYYTHVKSPVSFQKTYLSYQTIVDQVGHARNDVSTSVLFPDFVEGGSKTFNEHIKRLQDIIKINNQSFTYVYWTSPDLEAHEHGIASDKVKSVVKDLNKRVEAFSKTLKNDTLMVIIADHGLIDVDTIILTDDDVMMSCLLRMPSFEPRATNFFIKDGMHDVFEKHFKSTYKDAFKLLTKEEIIHAKLFGEGTKHVLFDDFLGDFVAIAIDKYMFGMSKGAHFKAHHAGLTQQELDVPLIIYAKN